MKAGDFKGTMIRVFYKGKDDDFEHPIATVIDEVEGVGLYVDFEGTKEVVLYAEICGWGVLEEESERGDEENEM